MNEKKLKSEPLNVCMLAYSFYEIDNRIIRYAETLQRLQNNVEVIALGRPGAKRHEVMNGVVVFRIQNRTVNEISKLSYLFKILLFILKSFFFIGIRQFTKKYDIVHVHSVPDFLVFAPVIAKILGSKIILDIHDVMPEFYLSKFPSKKSSIIYKLLVMLERRCILFSDHIIISNHIWEKKLKSRSILDDNLSVFLNYPDSKIFHKIERTRGNKKFVFLYPGTILRHQGLDIAVKALSRIGDSAPQAELHIYGEGTYKNNLLNTVKKLHMTHKVRFKDFVPLAEIASVMAQADVGIIPKRDEEFGGEAFSTKSLEFMRVGVPIIIAKTKIDNFYFNDDVVKFFNPGDDLDLAKAMLGLIRDNEERKNLIKNGYLFSERYVWDIHEKKYIEIIRNLIENS